jgi:DNA-binding transcriptional regulator YiaG
MKPMTNKEFRAARKKLQLTQRALGEFTNTRQKTISDWENKTGVVSIWATLGIKYLLLQFKK